jgi:hypothetical protein
MIIGWSPVMPTGAKGLFHVERQLLHHRQRNNAGGVGRVKRVAVGRCSRGGVSCKHPACHQHLLLPELGELVGDYARHDIGAIACGGRRNQLDRFCRIVGFGHRRTCESQRRGDRTGRRARNHRCRLSFHSLAPLCAAQSTSH